ncbi:MAG: hypothetical protein II681_00835 [Bacteroidaceae bacterium]|nr:hypothetical protein [Bacteroidaceae bacterium]MBQ3992239.1 hypothetical protein [Bacteroidaceae bacterium]
MRKKYIKVLDDWQLADVLHQTEETIHRHAFIGSNLTAETELALAHRYRNCLFLGCALPQGFKRQTQDCLFFPNMGELFHLCTQLYTPERLYEGYEVGNPDTYQQCFDGRVYRHYLKEGKIPENIKETLARTLHDHSISDCLHEFLAGYAERNIVGVMGGHGLARTEKSYGEIARLSKCLTEDGFLMVSGGGPGAMEATHLGAWMAGRTERELQDAIESMSAAPHYTDAGWLDTAMRVREKYPQRDFESLGIPTWLYGHEPSTPLATKIAKYFDNSIREDGILTIAKGGIIYSPGSAGTLQEIFQEAVQDHYLSFGYASPMIFMGVEFWRHEIPVWPFLMDMVERGKYKNLLLSISDSREEIVQTLRAFRSAVSE